LPSATTRIIGFSQYTSLPSSTGAIERAPRQWSGVAMMTASMSLRAGKPAFTALAAHWVKAPPSPPLLRAMIGESLPLISTKLPLPSADR